MSRSEELAANLAEVNARITRAAEAADRDPASITLVAVTKTWPASDAALLRDLGVVDLAENRDQEASQKAAEVGGVRWHFVGQVQTNKARSVASYADVVHSVDRPSLVAALGAGAVSARRTVEVLLQVSLDGERGGALPADLPALADLVVAAEGLRLAGVMAIAPVACDPAQAFAVLRQVADELTSVHASARVISAGMSGDFEQAIAAGATHVRVGTAVLGPRSPRLG